MRKQKTILFTILAISIACFFLITKFSWTGPDGKGYTRIIESDGKGYYRYLPALFIDQNIDTQTPDQRFIFKTANGAVNKYYAGTALCMSPFFAVGYMISKIDGETTDGYSPTFQKSISFAGLFYLALGIFFISKLLLLYEIKPVIISITLTCLVFGTNLLMYAVYHPSFSHIYSFAFISIFLFLLKKQTITHSFRNQLLLALTFGMILIIRPTNAIVILLIPFICGSFMELEKFLKSHLRIEKIALTLFLFLLPLAVQIYLWYLQTGEYFIWSYKNEGFYFLHPAVFKTLFSFRKGFFIYTPVALLALSGLLPVFQKSKFSFISGSLFILLFIYITSAWWCWYYGPSFGQRSFIDIYGFLALLLAILFSSVQHVYTKRILFSLGISLLVFNLLQSFQYVKGILSSWDMSAEKYKYVFLRTSPEYYSCLGGCRDIKPYGEDTLLYQLNNDFEKKYDLWNDSKCTTDKEHHNVADFSNLEFNSGIEITADDNLCKQRLLYAEIEVENSEKIPSGKKSALLVVSLTDKKNNSYSYYSFPVNEIPNATPNVWKKHHYTVEIPQLRSPGDKLKIYIWNQHLNTFRIDNFKIKLLGIK